MQLLSAPEEAFQILHTDHFGPLSESFEGFKHILVLVDAFTRFTWFFLVKSTSTREVIKHFFSLFNIFGNPFKVVSNKGTVFFFE